MIFFGICTKFNWNGFILLLLVQLICDFLNVLILSSFENNLLFGEENELVIYATADWKVVNRGGRELGCNFNEGGMRIRLFITALNRIKFCLSFLLFVSLSIFYILISHFFFFFYLLFIFNVFFFFLWKKSIKI